jgi:hypothetical protein
MRPVFVAILICISLLPKNSDAATWWLGADVGINSYFGLISELDFIQNRISTIIHLDIENSNGGYLALSYKIPIKIAFLPVGVAIIAGGDKNNLKANIGVYAGLRYELKEIDFYLNSYLTPSSFENRRLQYLNIDAGISFAISDIWHDIFSSGYSSE